MKKKNIIFCISTLLILSAIICACTASFPSTSESNTTDESSKRIEELEEQILTLIQSQQLSDSERKKQIELLEQEIKKLKESQESHPEPDSTQTEPQIFIYRIENGSAIITEINTDDEAISIPAVIDGYRVSAIGTQALCSSTVKSIVISSGIEKLDWFAFSGCVALTSVSIPDSVTSIGYGAFDNTSGSLTLYCSRDSFAHKYAQSYGITYGIT